MTGRLQSIVMSCTATLLASTTSAIVSSVSRLGPDRKGSAQIFTGLGDTTSHSGAAYETPRNITYLERKL